MPCDPDQASLVRLSTALASVGRLGFTVSEGAQTPCLRVTCKRSSALGLPLGSGWDPLLWVVRVTGQGSLESSRPQMPAPPTWPPPLLAQQMLGMGPGS